MAPETTETATDWILADNLVAWCRIVAGLVRQCFDDDDLAALEAALPSTDAEGDRWYEYPMRGEAQLVLRVAQEVGSDLVFVSCRYVGAPCLEAQIEGVNAVLSEWVARDPVAKR
jgi:hypothetical protein